MQVRSTRHAKTPQRTTALTNLCFAIFASELCFPSLLTVLAYSGCSSVESREFGLDFQDAEIGSTETPVWEDYTLKIHSPPSRKRPEVGRRLRYAPRAALSTVACSGRTGGVEPASWPARRRSCLLQWREGLVGAAEGQC